MKGRRKSSDRELGSLSARMRELERRASKVDARTNGLTDDVETLRLGQAKHAMRWGQLFATVAFAVAFLGGVVKIVYGWLEVLLRTGGV